jgi:hypothetical protein
MFYISNYCLKIKKLVFEGIFLLQKLYSLNFKKIKRRFGS